MQRIDLADLAEDVAIASRRRTGRDVLIRVGGDTTVDGRPTALQRAISNLVENAAKFDREGKAPIEIAVTGPARARRGAGGGLPRSVRIEVLDRGPGVVEGDLVRVFDRFYRATDALQPARFRARSVHRPRGGHRPRRSAVRLPAGGEARSSGSR